MKENFAYENHTGELKKSLSVGTACVGIVAGRIWEANREVIKLAVRDAIHNRTRQAWLKEQLKNI